MAAEKEKFIGSRISIEMKDGMGFLQGTVTGIETGTQKLILNEIIHDGRPTKLKDMTISASKIENIEILQCAPKKVDEFPEKVYKRDNITVNETTQETKGKLKDVVRNTPFKLENEVPNKFLTSEKKKKKNVNKQKDQRSSTLDAISKTARQQNVNLSSPHHGERYRHKNGSVKKQHRHQMNENTFGGECHESHIGDDFDFEESNKLFDKKAVADEINRRYPNSEALDSEMKSHKSEPKYRCDENVIPQDAVQPQSERGIKLPKQMIADKLYSTDFNFEVPSVTPEFHSIMMEHVANSGFSKSRQIEVTGRSAAELVMQLLGGIIRFEDKNSHQAPKVVILCGNHEQGALGLNTARQLLTQEIPVTVLTPKVRWVDPCFAEEMGLYKLSMGEVFSHAKELSSHQYFDILIDARLDHTDNALYKDDGWIIEMTKFAKDQICPVVALNPPDIMRYNPKHFVPARALVVPVLPLNYSVEQGLPHLVKLSIPSTVFFELGIDYKSPFKNKFMVPLSIQNPSQ